MFEIDRLIKMALQEDIGIRDLTTSAIIERGTEGNAHVIAKEDMILVGIDVFHRVFMLLNSKARLKEYIKDGEPVRRDDIIAEIFCDVSDLLMGERVALNFLQRLSGIASLTHTYVEKIKDYSAQVVDTRKTTPGWRALEKYAVKMGGGKNHRSGLFDGVLIKDNHIKTCGGIRNAIEKAKVNIPHTSKIEVEVSDLSEVKEAVESGAEVIMLDNMDIDQMEKAVRLINKRAVVEASGGVNLDTIADIAKTGVDLISVGALTHSARACDISMTIVEVREQAPHTE
ncbi:MAG: carboxylating nicotinate-nucleotide diphosphorylase [Thermodesulfobacteriota bacterium]|nr:carboxylating nicotinate-nucleotide diphosphorylase [Thermodesulfobacteriota bacterium]